MTGILDSIAGRGLGWAVAVLLALVIVYLFLLIQRLQAEQRAEDRKTIEKVTGVIAANTTATQLLTETVRGNSRAGKAKDS